MPQTPEDAVEDSIATKVVKDGSLDYRDSNAYTVFMRCEICGEVHLIQEFGVCSKG